MIYAVDPGTFKSAFVFFDPVAQRIVDMGIEDNNLLVRQLSVGTRRMTVFAIEMIASFGFSVGKEIFETVWWTGRFHQAVTGQDVPVFPVTRKQVVVHHTGKATTGDSAVRASMIARFGKENLKGCVYDIWSALAIASCVSDHLYGKVADTFIGSDEYMRARGFAEIPADTSL